MLGFGIIKLIFTIIVIAAIWYGSKRSARLWKPAMLLKQWRAAIAQEPAGRPSGTRRRTPSVEETMRCTSCGAYLPLRDPTSCGRDDCPYPG